jgi:hypothetical protein
MVKHSVDKTSRENTVESGDQASPEHNFFDRRDFLYRFGHTAAGATFLVSALALVARHNHLKESTTAAATQSTYGSLENPRYTVLPDLKLAPLPTYDELKRDLECDISSVERANLSLKIKKISDMIDKLEEVFATRETILNPLALDEQLTDAFRHPGELCREVSQEIAHIGTEISARRRAVHGRVSSLQDRKNSWIRMQERATHIDSMEQSRHTEAPYDAANSIVQSLTGNRMPEGIRFAVGKTGASRVIGEASFHDQSIVVRNQEYTALVLTIVHEMGHLICQQDESVFLKGGADDPRGEHRFLEEAAAFGFELLAASWIMANAPEQAELAKVYAECKIFSLIDGFYSRTSRDRSHAQGMAYLDAAVEACGSLGDALNYLITHDQLTPEMKRIISQKAVSWRRTESVARFEDVCDKIEQLRTRWESFCDRAGVVM